MRVRELRDDDLPILEQLAERSGFPYVDLRCPRVEAVLIVADDEDRPMMALAAERIVQAYLWIDKERDPASLLAALRMIQEPASIQLRNKGYNSLECFLPPEIECSFGRRLMRSFGFVKNWASFNGRL